jgi:hypothetical protein
MEDAYAFYDKMLSDSGLEEQLKKLGTSGMISLARTYGLDFSHDELRACLVDIQKNHPAFAQKIELSSNDI